MSTTYTIKHKTSVIIGKEPSSSDIMIGELAINASDGVLYAKMTDDSIRKLSFAMPDIDYGKITHDSSSHDDFGLITG